ncbi:MAG: hypothetical protein A3G18_09565 [Rhodospirillales bacterium RIFCSPLOWO2_12_FULL_58_28]|nr:MAG: hypothetical protein A3H92_02110 [Rhodospirillales bacterium RIFCSPLOWO2_02_FULL_58_16]OHC76749.1 MAG: hypothetical protein A3G18_09565 [Rhodospirillales bacterium RIFCSPLOWO2_12_FULL_58_28]
MKERFKAIRKSLDAYFSKVYASDSIPRGILQATRPNDSFDWDEEGDARRGKKNAASFIKNYDAAVESFATRKP